MFSLVSVLNKDMTGFNSFTEILLCMLIIITLFWCNYISWPFYSEPNSSLPVSCCSIWRRKTHNWYGTIKMNGEMNWNSLTHYYFDCSVLVRVTVMLEPVPNLDRSPVHHRVTYCIHADDRSLSRSHLHRDNVVRLTPTRGERHLANRTQVLLAVRQQCYTTVLLPELKHSLKVIWQSTYATTIIF